MKENHVFKSNKREFIFSLNTFGLKNPNRNKKKSKLKINKLNKIYVSHEMKRKATRFDLIFS